MPTLRRIIDVAVGITGLAVLSPALALIQAIARYESGMSGIFYQERYGLQGKPFTIQKIRTLDNDFKQLPLAGRLRSLGLDELPQLANIVKGEMSIFGPRPTTRLFEAEGWAHRFSIKPGLIEPGTVASKESRDRVPFDEIIALTNGYVDARLAGKWCIAIDLDTALRAIRLVLCRRVDAPNVHAPVVPQRIEKPVVG
jgi:sugar transferase EpsL